MIHSFVLTTLAVAGLMAGASAQTAGPSNARTYALLTHAAFFSVEAHPANLVDPQAFVRDPAAAAATAYQGIAHVAGFRPAYGVDSPETDIFNAQGQPLRMTLGAWFGARANVTVSPAAGGTDAAFSFAGLVPRGHYSVFENHFAESGVTFTPADGDAKTNSFDAAADGTATLRIRVPGALTHAEALLLVYHSDGVDHGMQRGAIGVNVHHQLIVRVP